MRLHCGLRSVKGTFIVGIRRMILLTIFEVSNGIAQSCWSCYTTYRGRNVSLGIVRLSANSPIGYHWAVQVDNIYWKPKWFEVQGKISYAQWYASTKIASSKGGKSLLGAEPFQKVGITKRTDDDIEHFNQTWSLDHPNYSLLSENCQMYASDLIEYLCGEKVASTLPWQEGRVVQQTSYVSLGSVALLSIGYGAIWAYDKFMS